jgi:hypothetical protein
MCVDGDGVDAVRVSVIQAAAVDERDADWTDDEEEVVVEADDVLVQEEATVETENFVDTVQPPPKNDGSAVGVCGCVCVRATREVCL